MYQNINFSINFNGQIYSTKGYVALSSEEAKVGANRTGFALFRVNRAIKINEKPYEIFGSTPNSPLGFKLYGELDMDDFEVNQAKDGLAWSPELKELFYNTLASNIQKIVSIGRLPWKKIHELEKPKVINTPVKTVPTTPKPENVIITSNNTNTSEITTITSPVSYIQEETPEKNDIIFNYAGNDFTIKIEELNNAILYKIAEFDNYRKRTIKEKAELILNGGEKTITALLPVLDDLERAMQHMDKATDVNSLREGVELIINKLQKTLSEQGLSRIDTANADFTTDLHEAIAFIPAPTEELKGKVVDCVQAGYKLNEKVIRYAKVAVGQ
jgi:molecular chaperone GrpE